MEIILSTIIGSNFLIAENDYPKELSWIDAQKVSSTIGAGWRLPTKEELNEIYLNKEKVNIKSEGAYWSASETDDVKTQRNILGFSKGQEKNAWLLDFTNGEWYDFIEKTAKFRIRFVKDYGVKTNPVKIENLQPKSITPFIKEIKIGSQIWMAENLNVDKFRNGDLISEAKTNEEWENAIDNGQPAWCYVNNDSATGLSVGKLYNQHAIFDLRRIAPEGWHIPNDVEWEKLDEYFFTPRKTKESCFSLAMGVREYNGNFEIGTNIWWSSNESLVGWSFELSYFLRENYDGYGLSIQCIKNS